MTTAHRKKLVVVSVTEIKELAAGFVLENRVRMMLIGFGEYCCGANATCASKCAEQMCTRRHHCGTGEFCRGNAPSYLRKCAKSCINISCTYNSQCASGENCCSNKKCALSCRGKRCTFYWNCAQVEPVVPDYVFRDVIT